MSPYMGKSGKVRPLSIKMKLSFPVHEAGLDQNVLGNGLYCDRDSCGLWAGFRLWQ